MTTKECVSKRVQQLCYDHHMTVNALANQAGMSPSSVKNVVYGVSNNPGIITIKMICDGLGITLTEFFDTDEFRNLDPEEN